MQIKKSSQSRPFPQLKSRINLGELSHKFLVTKYAESFNFYFAKSVNEILGDVKSAAEITYRDWLHYDHCQEIMRRYYNNEESVVRLKNYTSYYANLDELVFPCFEHMNVRKLMFKRRKRKFKLNRRETNLAKNESDVQNREICQKNRNFLRRLGNPTIYLEDLYLQNSAVENHNQNGEREQMLKRSIIVYDSKAEIHDIYNPVFSSEEEKNSRSLEKVLNLKNRRVIDNNKLELSKLNDGLSVSAESLRTKISEFEQFEESYISPQKISSPIPTQQTLLDIICIESEKEITKNQKRKTPPLSQRSHQQSSEITKAIFLNFKKKNGHSKEEYNSKANITKIMQESGKNLLITSGPKKDRKTRIDVSPKHPGETTQLKNLGNSKNKATKLNPSYPVRNSSRPAQSLKQNNSDRSLSNMIGKDWNKSKDKNSQNQGKKLFDEKFIDKNHMAVSPNINHAKESKININFSLRFKEKLKKDSFINRPILCASEKLLKSDSVNKFLNYKTSAQKELNYNLFQGAFKSENKKGFLQNESDNDRQLKSMKSNIMRKCPTDRVAKFVVKRPTECIADPMQTYVGSIGKNSVDVKMPVTLSGYVRSILQRSQKKSKGKELQHTISNITSNKLFSKMHDGDKSPEPSQNSKNQYTHTLKDIQMGETSALNSNPSVSKLVKDKENPMVDKIYSSYSINKIPKLPFSPISTSKNHIGGLNMMSHGTGFHLKAHTKKENRLDEYQFFHESPSQKAHLPKDVIIKKSLSKNSRTLSSKNLIGRIDSVIKNSKTSVPIKNKKVDPQCAIARQGLDER
jgi:hypothetical protein